MLSAAMSKGGEGQNREGAREASDQGSGRLEIAWQSDRVPFDPLAPPDQVKPVPTSAGRQVAQAVAPGLRITQAFWAPARRQRANLVIWLDCARYRTATNWAPGGPTLRVHIGLE
jgi:hypothetical protein